MEPTIPGPGFVEIVSHLARRLEVSGVGWELEVRLTGLELRTWSRSLWPEGSPIDEDLEVGQIRFDELAQQPLPAIRLCAWVDEGIRAARDPT